MGTNKGERHQGARLFFEGSSKKFGAAAAMNRTYVGVPYRELTPAMRAELDADVRDALGEDAQQPLEQPDLADVDDAVAELEESDWASLMQKGPPR